MSLIEIYCNTARSDLNWKSSYQSETYDVSFASVTLRRPRVNSLRVLFVFPSSSLLVTLFAMAIEGSTRTKTSLVISFAASSWCEQDR